MVASFPAAHLSDALKTLERDLRCSLDTPHGLVSEHFLLQSLVSCPNHHGPCPVQGYHTPKALRPPSCHLLSPSLCPPPPDCLSHFSWGIGSAWAPGPGCTRLRPGRRSSVLPTWSRVCLVWPDCATPAPGLNPSSGTQRPPVCVCLGTSPLCLLFPCSHAPRADSSQL